VPVTVSTLHRSSHFTSRYHASPNLKSSFVLRPVRYLLVYTMFRAKSCNVQSSSQAYGQQKSNDSTGGTTPAERAKMARERALQIKRAQEQALASLPQRHLYIVLWIRRDPPITNDFHWEFYYHKNASGGTKYHMRNVGGGWLPDLGPTGGVFKSNFLCILV
jgi:hypothetical protein